MSVFEKTSMGRFVVEGIVIGASILAAFGLQAWWDDHVEREEERQVLTALLEETKTNRVELGHMQSYHREALENVVTLLEIGASRPRSIAPDSIDVLLANASGWQIPAYDRGALDLTLLGGKLPLVESTALARQITAWQRSLETILDFERDHLLFMEQTWMPFLRSNASTPQLANAQTAILGGGDPYNSDTPVAFSLEHASLLRLREFHNILQEKKWVHEDMLRTYEVLEHTLTDLSAALERSVGTSPEAS